MGRNHSRGTEIQMSLTRCVMARRGAGLMSVAFCMSAFAGSSAFGARVVPDTINTSAKGACGTLPTVAPNDPKGLLRKLPKGFATNYQGFRDYPIATSAWANWKPKRKSGWNVQIIWAPPF